MCSIRPGGACIYRGEWWPRVRGRSSMAATFETVKGQGEVGVGFLASWRSRRASRRGQGWTGAGGNVTVYWRTVADGRRP